MNLVLLPLLLRKYYSIASLPRNQRDRVTLIDCHAILLA